MEITCKCPGELTVAWLDLYYPQFVLASRAAAKTDYDILVDGYKLGLCDGDAGAMPECSIPYLERIAPQFVVAAKSQGKTDREMLRDAVAIGLCAKPSEQMGTTAREVTEIAPGSEQQLESEFDPPAEGARTPARNLGIPAEGSHCAPLSEEIPDFGDLLKSIVPEELSCLIGTDRAAALLGVTVGKLIEDACSCPPGGLFDTWAKYAHAKMNEWTPGSKTWGNINDSLISVARYVACLATSVSHGYATIAGGDANALVPVWLTRAIAGAWERWIGPLPEQLVNGLERAAAFLNPSKPPTAAEANSLYAANFITRGEWECFVRAEGMQVAPQTKIVGLFQARPTDDQLLIVQRKAQTAIDNAALGAPSPGDMDAVAAQTVQQTVMSLYANNGWTNADNWQIWQTAAQWVPAPTDAIEWMLKDVQDPDIQSTFLLSSEFAQKYNGHVKDVFTWNGISENDALQIWKAHWRNMAPHQLYEMHKRLRPGWTALMSDVEVTALALNIAPEMPLGRTPAQLQTRPVSNGFPIPTYISELPTPKIQRAWLESLTTTAWHVSEALGQDDYPAFWRARQIALSYNVMGRIDLRRAYAINAISYERLIAGYLDQGSKPSDAEALAAFTRANQIQAFARNSLCNQWVNSGYDLSLLQDALEKQGMRPDMGAEVLDVIKAKRSIKVQIECINSVKKPYLIGLLSDNDATAKLANIGLANDRITELLNEWRCLKAAKSKQETAAQICLYFRVGLVSGPEARQAMMALGYRKDQATRILATCYIRKLPKTIQPDRLPEALQAIGP